jgi:hypothetical protein
MQDAMAKRGVEEGSDWEWENVDDVSKQIHTFT